MAPTFILDSSALLAFLYDERGREQVESLLHMAAEERATVRVHRIHLCEVYYILHRKGGEQAAEQMLKDLRGLPVRIDDRVSPALVREAGKIKASHRLSLADAFAAGLAKVREGTLVTSDRREFEALAATGEVPVQWTR